MVHCVGISIGGGITAAVILVVVIIIVALILLLCCKRSNTLNKTEQPPTVSTQHNSIMTHISLFIAG